MPIFAYRGSNGPRYIDDTGREYSAAEMKAQSQDTGNNASLAKLAIDDISNFAAELPDKIELVMKHAAYEQLDANYHYYKDSDADRNTDLQSAAQFLGIAVDTIAAASTDVQDDAIKRSKDKVLTAADIANFPVLSEMLRDPTIMSQSFDDINALADIEQGGGIFSDAYNLAEATQELNDIDYKAMRNEQALDELDYDTMLRRKQLLARISILEERNKKDPFYMFSLSNMLADTGFDAVKSVTNVADSGEELLGSMTAGFIAGSALPGAGNAAGAVAGVASYFATTTAMRAGMGAAAAQYRNLSINHSKEDAITGAKVTGVATALLNLPFFGGVLSNYLMRAATKTGLLKRMAVNTAENFGLGAAMGAAQVAGVKVADGQFSFNEQDARTIAEGGMSLAALGGVMSLPGYGWAGVHALGEKVSNSKLAKRNPALVERLIDGTMKDGDGKPFSVSLDAQRFYDYLVTLEPQEAQKVYSAFNLTPERLKFLIDSGGDVSMTLGQMETKLDKTHRDALAEDIKTNGQMSFRELVDAVENSEAYRAVTVDDLIKRDESGDVKSELADVKRELEAEINQDVEVEVDSEPLYLATNLLEGKIDVERQGEFTDSVKLDLQLFGHKEAKATAKDYVDGNLSPEAVETMDVIAKEYGFSSAAELANAILESDTKAGAKAKRKQARTQEALAREGITDKQSALELTEERLKVNDENTQAVATEAAKMEESIANAERDAKLDELEAADVNESPELLNEADRIAEQLEAAAKESEGTISQEAHEKVYTPVLKALEAAGVKVSGAAKESALIIAKQADMLHKRFGVAYEDAPQIIVGDKEKADGTTFFMSSYDVSRRIKTLSGFRQNYLKRDKDGEPINKTKVTINGIVYPEERVRHVTNEHHLTDEQLDDFSRNATRVVNPCDSSWHTQQYGGVSIVGRVDGELGSYFTVLNFKKNGEIVFETAAFHKTKEAADAEIGKRINADVLLPFGTATSARQGFPISVESIQKSLGIVKAESAAPSKSGKVIGSYNVAKKLISVFESGNASTAIHESAHWYLSTIENLLHVEADKRGIIGTTAELIAALEKDDTMPKGLVGEIKQIYEWAKYSPEVLKEYEDTALEKEFAKHAEDIKNGVEGAEERFIQERFARGFERYLATGEAPTKELKSAFQRFRDWLIEIYESVQNLGQKDPPKEIKEIFDRMVSEDGGKRTRIEQLRERIRDLKAEQKEILRETKADLKEQARDKIADLKDAQREKVNHLKEEQSKKIADMRACYGDIIKDLRKEIKDNDEKRAARRGEIGKNQAKEKAREALVAMPLREAMDWRTFLKRADEARRKAEVAYSKAINKTPDAFADEKGMADKASLLRDAAACKNKELKLRAMARESLRYRDAASKLEREFKRDVNAIKNDQRNANKGKYTATKTDESFNAVGGLLEKFGILSADGWRRQPGIDANFGAYVDRMNNNLGIMRIPDWILKAMDGGETIDWQELTFEQALDVSNALKNVKQAANLENKLLTSEHRETITTTRDALMAELGQVKKKDWRNEKSNFLKNMWKDQYTFDTIISNLFGDNSKMHDIFVKRKWALDNKERAFVQKYDAMYRAIWDKYSAKEQRLINSHKIFIEELGIDLTKRQLMTIALNMGNEGNIAKLFPQDKLKIPIDVQGIKNPKLWNPQNVMRALSNNLDTKDWQTVQGIWNLLDDMTPDLVAHEKARTGFTPEMVQGEPFKVTLKDGTTLDMTGGYYPLSQDIRSGTMLAKAAEADTLADMLNHPKGLSQTQHGFMKQRTNAEYEVSLDPSLLARHIRNVGHDLYFRDYVSDLARITKSPEFEIAIKDALGMHGRKTMGAYLDQVVGEKYFDAGYDAAYQAASFLRRAMATNAIALNFRVIIQNMANLPLYVGAVDGFGTKEMLHAIGTYGLPYWTRTLFDWRGHEKYLQENLSPFMLELFRQPDTTFRKLDTMAERQDKGLTGMLGDISASVADFSAHLMWMTDSFASIPMWLEMYHKTLAETGNKTAAMEKADMLIRRVNGSANKADQSLFIRDDKHFYSFVNMFMGFFNTEFNRWAREASRFVDKPIQATPRALAFVASRVILFNLASELLMGEGPEDDESWGRWAVRKAIAYPFTISSLTKDLVPAALNTAFDVPGMPFRGSATLQPINSAYNAASAVGRFVKEPTGNNAETAAQGVTGTAMYLLQQPKWFWALCWNAYDWSINDMSFQTNDLFVRRPRKERGE